jgi:hypothetical protein
VLAGCSSRRCTTGRRRWDGGDLVGSGSAYPRESGVALAAACARLGVWLLLGRCLHVLFWGQPSWALSEKVVLLVLLSESRPVVWEFLARPNKGGVLGFHLMSWWRSVRFMSPSIWLKCHVPEGSTSKLHWALHACRLLDQMGFGRARLCFICPFGFRRSVAKLC